MGSGSGSRDRGTLVVPSAHTTSPAPSIGVYSPSMMLPTDFHPPARKLRRRNPRPTRSKLASKETGPLMPCSDTRCRLRHTSLGVKDEFIPCV